jgi:hypothetical protein
MMMDEKAKIPHSTGNTLRRTCLVGWSIKGRGVLIFN